MGTLTSKLVISLMDRVSGPARAAAASLKAIGASIRETGRGPIPFATRLDAAIARNNASLASARGGLIDAAAGYYILKNALTAPVEAATEFQSSMADVKKVVDDFDTTTQAGKDAFKGFQLELRGLAQDIPLAVTQLSEIAAAAGEAGFAGNELIQTTSDAAKWAVAFGSNARDTGKLLAAMQKSYGMSREEALLLGDALNHLSNNMASSAPDLMKFWTKAAPMASKGGFAQKEAMALGSAMIAAGFQAEVAATGFQNMVLRLTQGARATGPAKAAFKQLGLDSEQVAKDMQQDATGTVRDILQRISDLPDYLRASVMSDIFGNEAKALGALSENLDFFDEALAAVADDSRYAGSAFEEFAIRADTFEGRMQKFANSMYFFKVAVGNALIPALTQVMDQLTPLLNKLTDFADAHPKLTANVVSATAALIGFRVAMAGLRFIGLLGKGGVLSTVAFGYNLLAGSARLATRAIRPMNEAIRYQNTLAAMAGTKTTFMHRLAHGARALLFAVPGVSAFSGALGALGGAAAAVGAFLAGISAPVWAVVAAVAAAGFAVWKFWDRIKAIGKGVGQGIIEGLGIDKMVAKLAEMKAAFKETKLGQWISEAFPEFDLSYLIPGLGPIQALIDKLGGLNEIANSVKGWFGRVFSREKLSEAEAADVTASAKAMTERVIEAIKDALTALPRMVMQVLEEAFGVDLSDLIKWPEPPEWWKKLWGTDTPVGQVKIEGQTVFTDAYFDNLEAQLAKAKARSDELNQSLADRPAKTGRGGTRDGRERELAALEEEIARLETDLHNARVLQGASKPVDFDALAVKLPDQQAAMERIKRAMASGPLPTTEYLAELNTEMEATAAKIEGLKASLAEDPAKTGRGGTQDRRVTQLAAAEANMARLTAEEERAKATAEELVAALQVIDETNTNPEINQQSLDAALSKARQLQSTLSSINSGSAAPAAAPSTPPGRARGGTIWRGQDYLTGEEGPELITPSRNGYVHDARSTERMLAGGRAFRARGPELIAGREPGDGGRGKAAAQSKEVSVTAPITISIQGGQMDPSMIGAEVARQLDAAVKEAFRGAFGDTGTRFV